MGGTVIETGVDRLISLVQRKKKISVAEAAKVLSVPHEVIDEWASFLEEEGVLGVEYSFTTPYLVEKKATVQDVKEKAKELGIKKDYFVRKAESILDSLERQHTAIDSLQKEFQNLKAGLGERTDVVEKAFKELANYDSSRRALEKELTKQEIAFRARLGTQSRQLTMEEKRYQDLIAQIEKERKTIVHEQESSVSLRSQESKVVRELDEIRSKVVKLRGQVVSQDNYILASEEHLRRLLSLADKIAAEIETKRSKLDTIGVAWKKHQDSMIKRQDDIIALVKKRSGALSGAVAEQEKSVNSMKKFFAQKQQMEKIMSLVTTEHEALRQELITLVKKAKTFGIIYKKAPETNVQDLEKAFASVEKKKQWIEKRLGELGRTFSKFSK